MRPLPSMSEASVVHDRSSVDEVDVGSVLPGPAFCATLLALSDCGPALLATGLALPA